MKKLIAFLACVSFLAGCGRGEASPRDTHLQEPGRKAEYRKISAAEAHKMMAEAVSYILLDVRTAEEFREKRIEGALLIPDNEIRGRAEKELPDKTILLLVYCRSGRRSANAAGELIRMGYVNVYDFGGIIAWPYETAGG